MPKSSPLPSSRRCVRAGVPAALENEASYEYVGTREAQAEARKAEKEALNAEATIKPGTDNPDEGGGDDEGNLGE